MQGRKQVKLEPLERVIVSLAAARGPTGQEFEPIPGGTWLQKEVFVVLRNLEDEARVRQIFEPHRNGMYSEMVDTLLAGLVKDGIVDVGRGSKISLTSDGRELGRQILSSGKQGVQIVQEVKELLNDLDYSDLIIYVYASYPGWDEASEVRHILSDRPRRQALARRLYQSGKISAGRAAEVAGSPIQTFLSSASDSSVNSR